MTIKKAAGKFLGSFLGLLRHGTCFHDVAVVQYLKGKNAVKKGGREITSKNVDVVHILHGSENASGCSEKNAPARNAAQGTS